MANDNNDNNEMDDLSIYWDVLKGGVEVPFKYILDSEYLHREYTLEKKSIQKIAGEVGCSSHYVLSLLKKYNIPRRKRVRVLVHQQKKWVWK